MTDLYFEMANAGELTANEFRALLGQRILCLPASELVSQVTI